MDPYTGTPTSGIISVTVRAETTLISDILSTAAFGLGVDKSIMLFDSIPDVSGIIIDEQGNIHCSQGFRVDLLEI